ncbi:hypothetical protein, partial [Croceibacterium xixiisoli]|uniref:hypothetical protein n=1 Tax=Croceibacterium xixiisoli TaxID=1476466 RepID=UPI001F23A4F6
VARQAHNLKVVGSNPTPATIYYTSIHAHPASLSSRGYTRSGLNGCQIAALSRCNVFQPSGNCWPSCGQLHTPGPVAQAEMRIPNCSMPQQLMIMGCVALLGTERSFNMQGSIAKRS